MYYADSVYVEPVVYEELDHGAWFPGATDSLSHVLLMQEFIDSNLVYPEQLKEANLRGTVILAFQIGVSRELVNLSVIKASHSAMAMEAVRLVESFPKGWTPALKADTPVVSTQQLIVEFIPS